MSTDAFTAQIQQELHGELPARPETAEAPHVCPSCRRPFVQPVAAREVDDWHFEVDVQCANCEWVGMEVYDDEALELFDRGLDEGTRELLEAYETLALTNAAADFERVIVALHADALLPEDF
jgi:hypothetical protein